LKDDDTIVATLKRNEYVDVEWNDDALTTKCHYTDIYNTTSNNYVDDNTNTILYFRTRVVNDDNILLSLLIWSCCDKSVDSFNNNGISEEYTDDAEIQDEVKVELEQQFQHLSQVITSISKLTLVYVKELNDCSPSPLHVAFSIINA